MKGYLSVILAVGVLAGCQQQTPGFSWYHPQGGEYLFAYDKDQCKASVVAEGLQLGSDLDGPFFTCMLERGYYLVDGAKVLRAPAGQTAGIEPQVSTLN